MDICAKVEDAFVAYFGHTVTGPTIRRAREGGAPIDDDSIIVHAATLENSPDLPPGDGNYLVGIDVELTAAHGNQASSIRDPLGEVLCALWDINGARAFINTDEYDISLDDIEITNQISNETESRAGALVSASITCVNAVLDRTAPELIKNGTFNNSAHWILGSGWTISGGVASATGASTGLDQLVGINTSDRISLTFTVAGFGLGALTPQIIGDTTASGTSVAANGTYTQTIIAPANPTTIRFSAIVLTCTLDNVSARVL